MTILEHSSNALPSFRRMAVAACTFGGGPIPILLLTGKMWLSVSVALGVGISLGVCGLLFLFIERVMPLITNTGSGIKGSQFQFLFLLITKLIFIALVGAAFLTLREVSPVAVLCGFMLGQGAIIFSALRFRKPTHR